MKHLGKVAIAATALVAPALFAVPANADAKSDLESFCAGARQCTLSYSISTLSGADEGGPNFTAIITAGKDKTATFRAFHVGAKGKLTPVGPDTKVTTDKSGNATVKFTVDPLKAPMVGGENFLFQLTNATKDTLLPKLGGKVEFFSVNSHRAAAQVKSNPTRPGDLGFISLQYGITGDKYQAEVKYQGKWVNINYKGEPTTISSRNVASLSWQDTANFPRGEYPARIRNIGNNEVVLESTLRIGKPVPPKPQPTKPSKPKPTKPSDPTKPTKPQPRKPGLPPSTGN